MRIIYCYIKSFRNIKNQSISFSDRYCISYNKDLSFPEALNISITESAVPNSVIYRNSKLANIHLLVGKTGAGKTNIFQLIGMPESERVEHSGTEDSYFLLYEAGNGFVIELFNTPISDEYLPKGYSIQNDPAWDRIPDRDRKQITMYESMLVYRFKINESGEIIDLTHIHTPEQLAGDLTFVFNGYERYAFAACPYEDTHNTAVENNTKWQPRMNAEYQRTSLQSSCRFLKEYIETFDENNIKRKAALVIRCSNWSDTIKQHVDESLKKHDYWSFTGNIRENTEKAILGEPVRERKLPEIRYQFVHDLWTDYALYLRKWILYIQMFPSGEMDASQEFNYYYSEKIEEERNREYNKKRSKKSRNRYDSIPINPTELPDYEDISILKRLKWLCMWIDLRGEGNARSLLYQIYDDIKDIGQILRRFDNKYFTNETFTLPIEDMYLEENCSLVNALFERMEQYRPDDTGVFTKELLPYQFSCISSGEYQFAKVLGGIEEYCIKLSIGEYGNHPNMVYLLDEPETYMHPELCRTFLKRLDTLLQERSATNDIQVLISTHSPMLLSDVLPNQVTRLDYDSKGYCIIKNRNEKSYFGANIHTVLADGFFLDYTIGEYARGYLQQQFALLKSIAEKNDINSDDRAFAEELKTVIPYIGDELMKNMFNMFLNLLEDRI